MQYTLKALRFLLVLLLVVSWVFSGFPVVVFQQNPTVRTFTQTRIARFVRTAYASTAGPTGAGTAASGTTGTCTDNMNWTVSATDLQSNDTSYVSYSGGNWDLNNVTDIVEASNFGFSVSGTVTGITVEVLGWTPAGGGSYNTVQLFTDTTPTLVGSNKATGSLPTSDPGSTYTTFGGTSDTWTVGLTDTDVNSSTFGVGLCWKATSNNSTANIDQVRITITYSAAVPTVSSDAASSVTAVSSTLNGTVSSDGGASVTARGFAWGISNTLQSAFGTTTSGTGTGSFSNAVSGLVAGTRYYFRAYATNSSGTGYGSITFFDAGTDTTPNRMLRLFEGFMLRLFEGTLKLYQR